MTAGWERTLGRLVETRGSALHRHAFLLCGNSADADDLLQDALLRAFSRPLQLGSAGDAEAYVRRIMVNRYIDTTRRRKRWWGLVPLLAYEDRVEDPLTPVDARQDMSAALRSLPPRQRACLVLRYYEDLTVPAIARTLGCSEGAVKRYLSEATRRLASTIEPDIRRG